MSKIMRDRDGNQILLVHNAWSECKEGTCVCNGNVHEGEMKVSLPHVHLPPYDEIVAARTGESQTRIEELEKHRTALQKVNTELTFKNRTLTEAAADLKQRLETVQGMVHTNQTLLQAEHCKTLDQHQQIEALNIEVQKLSATVAVQQIQLRAAKESATGWENATRGVQNTLYKVEGEKQLLRAKLVEMEGEIERRRENTNRLADRLTQAQAEVVKLTGFKQAFMEFGPVLDYVQSNQWVKEAGNGKLGEAIHVILLRALQNLAGLKEKLAEVIASRDAVWGVNNGFAALTVFVHQNKWVRVAAGTQQTDHVADTVVAALKNLRASLLTAESKAAVAEADRDKVVSFSVNTICEWFGSCETHLASLRKLGPGEFIRVMKERGCAFCNERRAAADLGAYLKEQRAFSEKTFGPGLRTEGCLRHIEKEIAEARRNPKDLKEWIDIIILGIDGYWRHGGNETTITPDLWGKLAVNQRRSWPAVQPEHVPMEHVRDEDEAPLETGG